MLTMDTMAKRVLARYGSRDAACLAIEDRIIRCKTAQAELCLMALIGTVRYMATERGRY